MHVFVTGGTGLIGAAVISELLANGHTVLALARSDQSAQSAKLAGAELFMETSPTSIPFVPVLAKPKASFTWPSIITSTALIP